MAVYVDQLVARPPKWRWGSWQNFNRGHVFRSWNGQPCCRLMADSRKELEEFATRIGAKYKWKERYYDFYFFPLTGKFRSRAIQKGAIEVDNRWTLQRFRQHLLLRRKSGIPG